MARTTRPLTATQIEKAKPRDKLYRLYDGNGLVVNIMPSGAKYFYLQYKHPITNKAQMHKLGDYPALSLADAREKAQQYHSSLAQNIDPKTLDEQAKLEAMKAIGSDLLSIYQEWAQTKNYSEKHALKNANYIRHAVSVIGNKPVDKISTHDLLLVLKPIESLGHFEKLKKCRTLFNQLLSYAIATGRATQNPALHLRGAFSSGQVRHNPAIIDEQRLGELVRGIKSYQGYFSTRCALLFALYTFARVGEIRDLRFGDIDWVSSTWIYTPSKTKHSTQVQMITPLSTQAIQIIKQMVAYYDDWRADDLIFPSSISRGKKISENTLNQALKRLDFADEHTSHGFRATARTLLEERLKYDYRMIEMQLGHQVRDSNGRAYNRVTWLDERRKMMQAWADYLDNLTQN